MTRPAQLHSALLLLLSVLLVGCTPQPETFTTGSQAFSHPLQLTLRGLPEARAEAAAQRAIEDLLFVAEVSHPWKPGPLGRTNQLLGLEAKFSANPSVLPMIRKATLLSEMTRGYYAPAHGKLQQLWGFHSELPVGPVPAAEEIAAILGARPKMADIRIEGIRMHSTSAAVRLDFGPFAQGYALDTARQRLRESGVNYARLDNGNAVAVLGGGWRVSLPGQTDKLPLQRDETLVTLNSDDRAFSEEGRRYHPYLNPHTGYPGRGLRSVSVLHAYAATAAALAQALLAGGETKLAELIEVIPVEYVLARTADGRTITTAAMARRLGTVRD
jgi:thiamine biosynthesis lipoprotein